MSGYMRKIIYLRRLEQGVPVPGAGYIRLERKREYLFLLLTLTEGTVPGGSPVYGAYRKDGEWQYLLFGELETSAGTWETRVRLTSLPFRGAEEEISGFFVGTMQDYWAGELSDAGIPYEDLWKRLQQPEQQLEQQPVQQAVQQPEEPPEKSEETGETEIEGVESEGADPEKGKQGTEMYPFDDDEMHWCRQISPEDLSSLPMSCWHDINNTFLLHGYYNYRHLLYAGDGSREYLGVPGQYHRREQYLAGRFGFPRFKGTRKKRVTVGDFGYWLREIGGTQGDDKG